MTVDEAIAEVKRKKADRLNGQWIGEILVAEIERLREITDAKIEAAIARYHQNPAETLQESMRAALEAAQKA